VTKSNSDNHSQIIMKQKDYRFNSLWVCGIADFLYFSVLAWLTWYIIYPTGGLAHTALSKTGISVNNGISKMHRVDDLTKSYLPELVESAFKGSRTGL